MKVEGRDEVARLAASFNRSAARIEELVNAHRMLLSNASHELRTPLSRIRLGVELYKETGNPKYKAELERDIAELDLLIDEILLASRLDATRTLPASEEVDLLALVAEECARSECSPEGKPVTIRGDPRLLRRLIRNLLENARRHGKPPVRVELRPENGVAVLDVMDAGEGIPQAERERVFQPFHRLGVDGKGAGLGLALVRQIARLHRGDAAVAPRAGCTELLSRDAAGISCAVGWAKARILCRLPHARSSIARRAHASLSRGHGARIAVKLAQTA